MSDAYLYVYETCTADESTQQASGFATAAQFEAAFGQASDFSIEPAANEGNSVLTA